MKAIVSRLLPFFVLFAVSCGPTRDKGASDNTDADGDGYAAGVDCDDEDASAHPGATEACNDGVDNDCDGQVDQDDAEDCALLQDDSGTASDGDGDGRLGDEDCDDSDLNTYVGAYEVCDGHDSDCDGSDEDADGDTPGCSEWYPDADGDGIGAGAGTCLCQSTAEQQGGWSDRSDDCDDTNDAVGPDMVEACSNDVDDDCDGQIDETDEPDALNCTIFYVDSDKDGYGDVDDVGTCLCGDVDDHVGMITNNDDCTDTDIRTHCTDYAIDGDGDGYADQSTTHCQCGPDTLFTIDLSTTPDEDCDDTDPDTHPDALEVCEGGDTQIDNDCDGDTDPVDGDPLINDCDDYYLDRDDDGFGAEYSPISPTCRCTDPSTTTRSWSLDSDDCDDHDEDVNPSHPEVCNGLDDDCDDEIDDGVTVPFYADNDHDSYGNPSEEMDGCSGDSMDDWIEGEHTDCDDDAIDINPGEVEDCDTTDDDDCDGTADDTDEPTEHGASFYLDGDGDGYGRTGTYISTCESPSSGYVTLSNDCNDSDSSINPGETEVCDGIDQDCDGVADDGATVALYPDTDSDGEGDPATSAKYGCLGSLSGYVDNNIDCDDADATVTHLDRVTRCRDQDSDGYWGCDGKTMTDTLEDYILVCPDFSDSGASLRCKVNVCPGDVTYKVEESYYGDCKPGGSGGGGSVPAYDVNPGEDEVCDGVDNDCDGDIDEDFADIVEVCDDDIDNDCDGKTDDKDNDATEDCSDGIDNDCDGEIDEEDPSVEEICDGIDNDCDGEIDEDFSSVEEICDGIDNDCDGTIDNVTATTETVCDDGLDDDCDGLIDTDDDDCATTTPSASPPSAGDTCDTDTGVWP